MLNFVQATASVAPQLCQPSSGIIMTNDISETNPEDAAACIALSKNDSYVMSASGGKVSLFNMMTFKVIMTLICLQAVRYELVLILILNGHFTGHDDVYAASSSCDISCISSTG